MRLVLLGGSGSATPELADALVDWPGGVERRPELDIVLVSRTADRLRLVAAETRRRVAGASGAPIRIHSQTDRRVALDAADVIVNAVRIGGLAARIFDESFPRKRGLPGEETMGPGGFANAVRTVPALRDMWADVSHVAPDALLINLTNPSGIVVAAAEREFGLRVISMCDSPASLTEQISERIERPLGEVRGRYIGMNHVGWWVPGSDTELHATLDLAGGQEGDAVVAQGAIGLPYNRYYIHPDRVLIEQRQVEETRARQLQRLEAELLAGYAAGAKELPRRGAVWYGKAVLPLVDAWTNGSADPLTVGMRNAGRIPGLPDDVVTEGPVTFPKPGVMDSLVAPPMPPLPAAMLVAHAAFEALTVGALATSVDRAGLVRALMANPMVHTYDQAAVLVGDILAESPS